MKQGPGAGGRGPGAGELVLVTGATGFIGGHLVELLLSRGWRVRCLVRRPAELPEGAEAVRGDLGGEGLERAAAGVDVVFHLAGVTKARRAREYYEGNARGTERLVAACARVPRFVHVSSLAAVGPSADGVPLTEDAAPAPFTHYGKSKLEAERIVRASALGERAVIVRPPVVYGPRDTDVLHFFRAAARGLRLELGRDERFFSAVYVKDLVEGLLAAASPVAAGRTYFLAHPKAASWSELGAIAAELLARPGRVLRVPGSLAYAAGFCAEMVSFLRARPSIISREKVREARCRYWTCDPSAAARELGWSARTGLRAGVAETLEWYKKTGWLR